MKNIERYELRRTYMKRLAVFSKNRIPLPGIDETECCGALADQIIDSIRRIQYAQYIQNSVHDPRRMDPHGDLFDPLKASMLHYRAGRLDEAFWLVFLATHFGKHTSDKWRLVQDVYGRLGGPQIWDWPTVTANPADFRTWLMKNSIRMRTDGVSRRFSNHRKYESLVAPVNGDTIDAVESYVHWVGPSHSHRVLLDAAHRAAGQNPEAVFDQLYRSMKTVKRFGRLAKFDYLTMLGKLGIAPISPGSAYLQGATGPLRGARQLFTGDPESRLSARFLEGRLRELDESLHIGMQAFEDSLCNWQKSPSQFIRFRG